MEWVLYDWDLRHERVKPYCQIHRCSIHYFQKDNFRPLASNFIQKETLAQMFPCEFCEISKNTFFTEHLLATAS